MDNGKRFKKDSWAEAVANAMWSVRDRLVEVNDKTIQKHNEYVYSAKRKYIIHKYFERSVKIKKSVSNERLEQIIAEIVEVEINDK